MTKPAYREGDWFAVPLKMGGFGTVVVARANPRAALLGYFFGPAVAKPPSLADIAHLRPADAVLVGLFGHLGIREGRWPTIGREPTWDRSVWPMPAFYRFEELTGRTYRVVYADDDPGRRLRDELLADASLAADGPSDGLMGAGYVEAVLSRRLANGT